MNRRHVSSDLLPLPAKHRQPHLVTDNAVASIALPLHVRTQFLAADGAGRRSLDQRTPIQWQRTLALHPLIHLLGADTNTSGERRLCAAGLTDSSDECVHATMVNLCLP